MSAINPNSLLPSFGPKNPKLEQTTMLRGVEGGREIPLLSQNDPTEPIGPERFKVNKVPIGRGTYQKGPFANLLLQLANTAEKPGGTGEEHEANNRQDSEPTEDPEMQVRNFLSFVGSYIDAYLPSLSNYNTYIVIEINNLQGENVRMIFDVVSIFTGLEDAKVNFPKSIKITGPEGHSFIPNGAKVYFVGPEKELSNIPLIIDEMASESRDLVRRLEESCLLDYLDEITGRDETGETESTQKQFDREQKAIPYSVGHGHYVKEGITAIVAKFGNQVTQEEATSR